MSAYELIEAIKQRGGSATIKRDSGGQAKINVTPRSVALEFLPELRRLKPVLLELLEPERLAATQSRLMQLEEALGYVGTCRVIHQAWRRLARQQPRIWATMTSADRHNLAVRAALQQVSKSSPIYSSTNKIA